MEELLLKTNYICKSNLGLRMNNIPISGQDNQQPKLPNAS